MSEEETLKLALKVENELKNLGIETLVELQILISSLQAESAKKVGVALELKDESEPALEKVLSSEQKEALFKILEIRFKKTNKNLHPELLAERGKKSWEDVKAALKENDKALISIDEMEKAGHEPDVYNTDDNGFDVGTCSREAPKKQRNCTYDESVEMAKSMGIEHVTSRQYEDSLQIKGDFDNDSESWLKTPNDIRKSGNALCGLRYNKDVIVGQYAAAYHYSRIGWRGSLRVSWAMS